MIHKLFFITSLFYLTSANALWAQDSIVPATAVTQPVASQDSTKTPKTPVETSYINYSTPKTYEIGGITVEGATSLDPRNIILLSGLEIGKKITVPGDEISNAMDRLWKQGIFGNIEIYATAIQENKIFLNIEMEEQPRLNRFDVAGIRPFEGDKLKKEIELKPRDVLTDNKLNRLRTKGINFYRQKGYLNADIEVIKKHDTLSGDINLTFDVKRGNRVKIKSIEINGNEAKRVDNPNESYRIVKRAWRGIFDRSGLAFSDAKIRRKLKSTKRKNVFRFWKRSKYVDPDFRDDLKELSKSYNANGFRDMHVVKDSLVKINDKYVKLILNIEEGDMYYFGDIEFVGNTVYPTELLKRILDIQKGDVFDEEKLQQNLQFNPQQGDISSMYTDNGYMTFQAIPVEKHIENDTVNIEIRMHEGKQARINGVSISGNTRTNDHVIMRELRVYPGQLFSRSDIIQSLNELRMLKYFNDETMAPNVSPLDENGNVSIDFQLEEVGSDQVELSGGWGGGSIVGTLGFSFNNFSIQNLFKKERWRPLPSGDGQKLSIRAQSNGSYYYSLSTSYTEPWLGGKKPYAFSVSAYTSMQSNGYAKDNSARAQMVTNGVIIGLGQRLRVPDPNFTLYQSINYQHYNIYGYGAMYSSLFNVDDGKYSNINYNISLSRMDLNSAMFPSEGSEISLSLQMTPPYSLFNGKTYYEGMPDQEQFKWLEYYKWNFKASWFLNPVAKLVVNARMRFGTIGRYNSKVGYTPFERYKLGGDGMSAYSYTGAEVIGMRGYTNESLSPDDGAVAFNKMTFEARYPITTNPAATIYALAFVEAGNSWANPRQINPFQNYRSAGIGVRLFLAAMGMFGLDWGYGFDEIPGNPSANKGQFHFSINQSID